MKVLIVLLWEGTLIPFFFFVVVYFKRSQKQIVKTRSNKFFMYGTIGSAEESKEVEENENGMTYDDVIIPLK